MNKGSSDNAVANGVVKYPLAILNNPRSHQKALRRWGCMKDTFARDVTNHGFTFSNHQLHLPTPTEEEITKAKEVLGDDFELLWTVRFGKPNERRRAITKLTKKHFRLVLSISGPNPNLQVIGNVGLIYAIERFELERGLRLSTHATTWIRSQVKRYRESVLGYPIDVINDAQKMKRAEEAIYVETGERPDNEQLLQWAMENEIPEPEKVLICKFNGLSPEKKKKEKKNKDGKVLDDLWGETESYKLESEFSRDSADIGKIQTLLDPLEWKILSRYYGLENEKHQTVAELARSIGKSKLTVCDILTESLGKVIKTLIPCPEVDFASSKEDLLTLPLIAHTVKMSKNCRRLAIMRAIKGRDQGITLGEYGKMLDLSRERVRQLEDEAFCSVLIEHEIEMIPKDPKSLEVRKLVLDYFGLDYHEFKVGNTNPKAKLAREIFAFLALHNTREKRGMVGLLAGGITSDKTSRMAIKVKKKIRNRVTEYTSLAEKITEQLDKLES